jgi:flagellar biosynthesis GTPase FlhF
LTTKEKRGLKKQAELGREEAERKRQEEEKQRRAELLREQKERAVAEQRRKEAEEREKENDERKREEMWRAEDAQWRMDEVERRKAEAAAAGAPCTSVMLWTKPLTFPVGKEFVSLRIDNAGFYVRGPGDDPVFGQTPPKSTLTEIKNRLQAQIVPRPPFALVETTMFDVRLDTLYAQLIKQLLVQTVEQGIPMYESAVILKLFVIEATKYLDEVVPKLPYKARVFSLSSPFQPLPSLLPS